MVLINTGYYRLTMQFLSDNLNINKLRSVLVDLKKHIIINVFY